MLRANNSLKKYTEWRNSDRITGILYIIVGVILSQEQILNCDHVLSITLFILMHTLMQGAVVYRQ